MSLDVILVSFGKFAQSLEIRTQNKDSSKNI